MNKPVTLDRVRELGSVQALADIEAEISRLQGDVGQIMKRLRELESAKARVKGKQSMLMARRGLAIDSLSDPTGPPAVKRLWRLLCDRLSLHKRDNNDRRESSTPNILPRQRGER
jgi:hypothetical protein